MSDERCDYCGTPLDGDGNNPATGYYHGAATCREYVHTVKESLRAEALCATDVLPPCSRGSSTGGAGKGTAFWNARKDRLLAEGLCVDCGKVPARQDRTQCWTCSEKSTRRICPTIRRAMRCALCKRPGHDRRRCPGPGVRGTRG
jgi:hypothetical protein